MTTVLQLKDCLAIEVLDFTNIQFGLVCTLYHLFLIFTLKSISYGETHHFSPFCLI